MPSTATKLIGRGVTRIPGLKRLPVMKLLALGEIALLAGRHLSLLTPEERRRLVELVRKGHGRPSNLDPKDREELAQLVAKAEPRRFAGLTADALSPVPLPKRLVHGPKRR